MRYFTVKHSFRAKGIPFTQGDTQLDLEAYRGLGFKEEDMEVFYAAGWVDLDDREPGPGIDPNRVIMVAVPGWKDEPNQKIEGIDFKNTVVVPSQADHDSDVPGVKNG